MKVQRETLSEREKKMLIAPLTDTELALRRARKEVTALKASVKTAAGTLAYVLSQQVDAEWAQCHEGNSTAARAELVRLQDAVVGVQAEIVRLKGKA